MLKGNQRYNGIVPSMYGGKEQYNSIDGLKYLYAQNHDTGQKEKVIIQSNSITSKDSSLPASCPLQNSPTLCIKKELDQDFEQKITTHSIIDFEESSGPGKKIKNMLNKPQLSQQSVFIKTNNNTVSTTITKLEAREMSLKGVVELMYKFCASKKKGISQGNEQKISNLQPTSKIRLKRNNTRSNYHESLQRIGGIDPCYNHYQQYWFSSSLERLKLEDKSREERLEITRYELRRHLKQITKSNLGKADIYTEDISLKLNDNASMPHRFNNVHSGYDRLVPPHICDVEKCKRQALPCTRYCTLHIMHNVDQVLFDYCTAKFADNTQCSVPVFDITHELPLCPEHARKRDNYRMYQETKPKKLRKKVKPSAMIRPQKRNKKKKRPTKPPEVVPPKVEDAAVAQVISDVAPDLSGDMVEQVLALQEPDGLELVSVEQALVTQASNLLEESEINNVLSTIQADEFNDFFTVNRNGEYEPTREETEELERALAAVDNDVKSLEKLSQSQGLLDPFLDEHTLVESLVQIPDVFHNGYTPCGENIVTQTSRLLSVEPHSQS